MKLKIKRKPKPNKSNQAAEVLKQLYLKNVNAKMSRNPTKA